MSIKIQNVSKSFGGKKVLEHFTVEIPDTGITVLMAPSGAGKTTLLRILAGLEKPDQGTIENPYDMVGLMFQDSRLFPWLTAAENITETTGVSRQRATELLEQFFMGTELDTYPGELSGGMQRRVALARALAYGGVLLLDEPFNGLDEALMQKCLEIIKEYAGKMPVILITHNPEEARLSGGLILTL